MHDLERTGRPAVNQMVSLSPLTFGIMRLDRVGGVTKAAALIRDAVESAVTSFHASQEYATWPLFVEAWREANVDREGVQLIAKVGVPHFGEDAFDAAAFTTKIDGYRTALGMERVDVVQWLLRHDLKQEAARLAIFERDAGVVSETVESLKAAGWMHSLISFPYTTGMASKALKMDQCDGLAVYCNAFELEMVDEMDTAGQRGKSIVAIRPFAAGRLFAETNITVAEALALPLSHPAVATVVTSISSLARLREASAAANKISSDAPTWRAAVLNARAVAHV